MTHLRVVPDPPAEDGAPIKTWGDLLEDIRKMVADGHVGAAALRLADWAETYADEPLPELKQR